jgi:hypothetical protein
MTGNARLTDAAAAQAATLRLFADDVACLLFPRTDVVPSEELLATVRLTLHKLVTGIEIALDVLEAGENPKSWDLLCRSGLLRENALIDYCIARIAEGRIRARIDGSASAMVQQLPARLLHNADPLLSETARSLLAAESQSRGHDAKALADQVPPELLHLLAWRVVAALKTDPAISAKSDGSIEHACAKLLSGRKEVSLLQASAAKLVYFLPDDLRAELDNPDSAGLSMFVASIAMRTGLAADIVYRLIDSEQVEAFLIMMRASGFEFDAVLILAEYLRGIRPPEQNPAAMAVDYQRVSIEEAAELCFALGGNVNGTPPK